MSTIVGPKGRARAVYDAAIAEIERAGLTPGALTRAGKHYQLPVVICGRVHTITLPVSPSDPRAAEIKAGDVRRLLRREGVL